MGTVMEFNDGQPRKVLVLDAQYRLSDKTFRPGSAVLDIPEFHAHPSGSYFQFLHTENQKTTVTEAASITDAWINANVVKDTNTAKHTCDLWIKYNVTAVTGSRSISVNGTPCDVPNIQTLARIYCDAEIIDSMDASPSSAATKLLGSRNPSGAWNLDNNRQFIGFAWSSTMFTASQVWMIVASGQVQPCDNYFPVVVIPVLEL